MNPQCLSACGPCQHLCETCINAHNQAVLGGTQRNINNAIALLKNEGFHIQAPNVSHRPANDALRILLETNKIKM